MTRPNYEEYINGRAWAARRKCYYQSYEKVCTACGSKKKIHLHHHTYARLGSELDEDLVPLCEECHDALHRFHRAGKVSLTQATFMFIAGKRGKPLPKPKRRKARKKPRKPAGKRAKSFKDTGFIPRNHRGAVERVVKGRKVLVAVSGGPDATIFKVNNPPSGVSADGSR